MNNEKGIVNEIVNKEGLTAEEIKKELRERGITVKPYHIYLVSVLSVAAILWLLPAIAKYSGWRFLSFFTQLWTVEFPTAIIVIAALFIVAGISLFSQASHRRRSLGGLEDVDETIFIVKGGPYKIVRHPDSLGQMFSFPLIPVVLSRWVPFTILAIISCALVIGVNVHLIWWEERFNIRKWGEEYRQYMKEVPAINFIKGLWNMRKRSHQSNAL